MHGGHYNFNIKVKTTLTTLNYIQHSKLFYLYLILICDYIYGFRSVEPDDRTTALGFAITCICLIGHVPGKILYIFVGRKYF